MGRFAVIDIGSNTIRLVVYENRERAPYVIFNEKVFCGLGLGVAESGKMIRRSIVKATRTLSRFLIFLKKMDVKDYRAIATSAVRDALNGRQFVADVKRETGLDIKIVSGPEEAKLSGNGVICAVPRATGIIGDLGGGSLELALVHEKNVSRETTLPIGPLQFQDKRGNRIPSAKTKIDEYLKGVGWITEEQGRKFYAVGGSWRALAHIHMLETKYPLINMHNYVIPVEEIIDLAKRVSKMTEQDLKKYRAHISTKRRKNLPLAALVLWRLLKILNPCKYVVSAFGVREGILYNEMEPEVRKQDSLIISCHQVAKMTGRFPDHGERLYKWIDGLFENETEDHKRLRLAICILCDVGWRGHPEYRAEKVVAEVLYGRLGGVNHTDASLIAMALYVCYGGTTSRVKQVKTARSLISSEDMLYARRIGLSLRLAQRISAGTSEGLKLVKLVKSDKFLILSVKPGMEDMVNELVAQRLNSLSKFLDVDYKLTTGL